MATGMGSIRADGPAAGLEAAHGVAAGRERMERMLAERRLVVLDGDQGRRIVADADYAMHLALLSEIRARTTRAFPAPCPSVVGRCLAEAGLPIGADQRAAIEGMTGNGLSVVSGGPGTGKSTTVRTAARVLGTGGRGTSIVAAFSARIAVSTGRKAGLRGVTLHSLTGTPPGETWGRGTPLDPGLDAVFVDEAFSVEPAMLLRLLRLAAPHTRIALLGDPGQMPPIAGGRSLHDVLEHGLAPCFELTTSHRLAGSDHLRDQVGRIAAGHVPKAGPGLRICVGTGGRGSGRAKAAFAAKLLKGSLDRGIACVALTATRYGDCGHVAINRLVTGCPSPRTGDEVITTEGHAKGAWRNGERAVVTDAGEDWMVLSFDDGRAVRETRPHAAVALGYAMSGHRGQGLEYSRAVVVLDSTGSRMLSRQYLCSVLSRAADCIVLTDPGLLEVACRRDEVASRTSILAAIANGGVGTRNLAGTES